VVSRRHREIHERVERGGRRNFSSSLDEFHLKIATSRGRAGKSSSAFRESERGQRAIKTPASPVVSAAALIRNAWQRGRCREPLDRRFILSGARANRHFP
jgi:hypothetical protein